MGDFGAGAIGVAGGAVGALIGYGARKFYRDQLGNYYYRVYPKNTSTVATKTTTKRKRKQKYKKRCCKTIRGKKVCKPEFCPKKKRRNYHRKKYWY